MCGVAASFAAPADKPSDTAADESMVALFADSAAETEPEGDPPSGQEQYSESPQQPELRGPSTESGSSVEPGAALPEENSGSGVAQEGPSGAEDEPTGRIEAEAITDNDEFESMPVPAPATADFDAPDDQDAVSFEDTVAIVRDQESGHGAEQDEVSADPVAEEESAVKDDNIEPSASSSELPVADTGEGVGAANGGRTAHSLSESTGGKRQGLKPLSEGTILNHRYRIIRKIGGGGMGAVYLAADQNLGGVERAVKEMVQSSIEEEQQQKAVEDFRRESMILSTLDHPAIPTIYDYFFDDLEGRFYLVMKYISGGDLAARLRSTPGARISEALVTEWAIQVADVLSYLHNLPTVIVYRDLKPSNIMLDGTSGKVMLIDFGIARSINQAEKGVTAVGTMGYAPPELFSGQVEPRSDIYSLGSTMFHLLTGADPQNNPLLIFDFQKNPRPRQINPQMSDQMERILMKAVEYNADSRFTSADVMKNALAEHLENLRHGRVTYGVSEIPSAVSLEHQFVFCGFCGQRIIATDLFCAFCGAKQPIAQQGVHAEIYPRSAATAKLLIDGTSELDAPVFSLEKNENLLGRRDPQSNIFPEVDLSKFDPQTKISRRHARIWREGGNFMVEDLGSSNGTILLAASDAKRLLPRVPHPLANGDRLRLGDTTLHFLMG
jgi:serine/threonine-protein kinase